MKGVTRLSARANLRGGRIDLSWRNPEAAAFAGGAPMRRLRLVRRTRDFPRTPDDGEPVLDAAVPPLVSHCSDTALAPLTTYYYALFVIDDAGAWHLGPEGRASAFATADYGLAERLYRLLPAVQQRFDTPPDAAMLEGLAPELRERLAALPPALRGRGPLRRYLEAAAAPVDAMRSLAEGLAQLQDTERAAPPWLPLLAHWIGWEPDRTRPLHAQRQEIRQAPGLYRRLGSVPALRSLVTRYTGWHTRVAEMHQQLARSNSPPRRNLFAMGERGGSWRGVQDAAPLLGFGVGNDSATGTADGAARLVGEVDGPFSLRAGMELTLSTDRRPAVTVRFQAGDFAAIAGATAAEVAGVLDRLLSEVTVTAAGDRLVLCSHAGGPDSSLAIAREPASLVSLEGAPGGALCPFLDGRARLRLFYATRDPLEPARDQAARRAGRGEPSPAPPLVDAPSAEASASRIPAVPPARADCARGRIRYKTLHADGRWGASLPLAPPGDPSVASPTALALDDGRIFAAWIEHPDTPGSRLACCFGNPRDPVPAALESRQRGPYALAVGQTLALGGDWDGLQVLTLSAADFADPAHATAAEVAAAANTRLEGLVAGVTADGRLRIQSGGNPGAARLCIDLSRSSAASGLGFDDTNAAAQGDWGDTIDWQRPEDPGTGTGRFADLHALRDGAGGVWLFWSSHDGARWCIAGMRREAGAWSPVRTLAQGGGGNREPCALLDAAGRTWLFWARRSGPGGGEATWSLYRRRYDPTSGQWGPEQSLTRPALPGWILGERLRFPVVDTSAWSGWPELPALPALPVRTWSERQPRALLLADGGFRIWYTSTRDGGQAIESLDFDPAGGLAGAAVAVTAGAQADSAPAPVRLSDGRTWLLLRSDRSVSLSRVAAGEGAGRRSGEAFRDLGTLRRHAGTTSPVPDHAARLARRRLWDDLLAYTPDKPRAPLRGERLGDDDRYTPGTLALYLSGAEPHAPLPREQVQRLLAVLHRFQPLTRRLVVVLAPRVDVEYLYPPGADIGESYRDSYPLVERTLTPSDDSAAALPGWTVLLATTAGHLSADPADLDSLRRRSWYPPPL